MRKISEKETEKVLNTMNNSSVEIRIEGAIEVKHIINKVEIIIRSGVVILKDKEKSEYVSINLNEAYCTMTNKDKTQIQANIDSLNNDIIITIEKN